MHQPFLLVLLQTKRHLSGDKAYSLQMHSTVLLGTCSEGRAKLHG